MMDFFIRQIPLLVLFLERLVVLSLLPRLVGFRLQVCLNSLNGLIFPIFANTLALFMVGYSFGTVDLGVVMDNMREYVLSHVSFRFIMLKYYFDISGRSLLPDVLAHSYLDTTISGRWPQSISFECREIRKRKGCSYSGCPFCVHITFDRSVCGYVVKRCQLFHIGHVVNFSSTVGHVIYGGEELVG